MLRRRTRLRGVSRMPRTTSHRTCSSSWSRMSERCSSGSDTNHDGTRMRVQKTPETAGPRSEVSQTRTPSTIPARQDAPILANR